MAALGDSITRAYNTGWVPFRDGPSYSWATGTNVPSPARRLQLHFTYNDAKDGARMRDLSSQAARAASQRAQYVTILMGANDVCHGGVSKMTSVPRFRSDFEAGMRMLATRLPDARIQVLSIPDVYRLWHIESGRLLARTAWRVLRVCRSLLDRPESTAPADVARRALVRSRVVSFNRVLADVCAEYVHCRYDGGALFRTRFARADISTRDFFHPSRAGQAKLAAVAWSTTFDFSDRTAPFSTATAAATDTGLLVTLDAFDDAGAAGIEYRVAPGPYIRYTAPLLVPEGTRIVYRAVDVNGNAERAHVLTV
jgi:GDSL-like Lipase/Acylhydrolase family